MIQYYDPKRLIPPHRIIRPERVVELAESMLTWGWRGQSLVGYPWGNQIQLITGTHRRAAAEAMQLFVPVVVLNTKQVGMAWGDVIKWTQLLNKGWDGYRTDKTW